MMDAGPLPPTAVRASFALFVGVVVLSLLNAVIQISFRISGATVLVGALIEAVLFLVLGSQMRVGRLWARVTLMSVAWVFVAVSLLALFGLKGEFGRNLDGLVLFTLGYVTAKLAMIVAATVLMYRPSTRGYFH
ncbi:MAG: hypothetical protein QOG57_3865 [Pseudonocardiales bacterium]|jgi:hypothetical protein|nr:hypothetical protein [Pseudonocardia sp.]MDT7562812.1 hypothetical protein [Pseudonocardiales bacterium]MDT7627251.1 hypothetical protein [Pseudonocardiales bacterium]MDT7683555.1 hypothetical protein [Pseudonocardiales bacterium]MDT7697017.1 hypothetical protein [Pseudonocardiales bacterium]